MTTPLSMAVRQSRLLAVRNFLDGGELRFYTGADEPVTPESIATGNLLGSVKLNDTSGAISSIGELAILSIGVPLVGVVTATGVIGWVRFVDSVGNGIMDRKVVQLGSIGPVIVSSIQVYAGGEMKLLSCVISE